MAKLTTEDIELRTKIKTRINNVLDEKGLKQSKYAFESDTDRQLVNRWVNDNDTRGVSIYTINRFCKNIKMTLEEFFNDPLFK